MQETDYSKIREEFCEWIKKHLFYSIDEALSVFDPAQDDKDLQDRLATDPECIYQHNKRLVMERVSQREALAKSGKAVGGKDAKATLSLLADEKEWARLNSKPFSSIGLLGMAAADKIIIASPGQLPTKAMQAELAARQAKDVEAEKDNGDED